MKKTSSTTPTIEEIKIAVDILRRTISVDQQNKAVILRFEDLVIFVTKLPDEPQVNLTIESPAPPFFN